MFYWSYYNFKMIEEEFEIRIKDCISFPTMENPRRDHGVFSLENDKYYYVIEGMMGFHIFETIRMVSTDDTLFLINDQGTIKLLDKKTFSPISMEYVMKLPLEKYHDVIPHLIHVEEDKHQISHCIVVGDEPEDKEDMVCVQEYHDGFRTVWISQDTLNSPIVIDEGYWSLNLPEELESLCDFIDNSKEEIEEIGKKTPRTSFINCVYINFVYKDKYYRLLPRAFDLHPELFDCIIDGVEKELVEMGSPYVDIYKQERW